MSASCLGRTAGFCTKGGRAPLRRRTTVSQRVEGPPGHCRSRHREHQQRHAHQERERLSPGLKTASLAQESATLAAAADECKLWDNLGPDDRIWPLDKVPLTKMDELHEATGRFAYVVLPDGTMRVTRLGDSFGHVDLAQGGQVIAAGEVKLRQGNIKSIDNRSGHYQPKGPEARTAAEEAFRGAGFEVGENTYKERW